MKVLDSRVALQVDKTCTQKIGEIEIPVGAGEYERARVVSIGPEIQDQIKEGDVVYISFFDQIKEGDVVYIYPNAGKKFSIEGTEFRLVTSNEIIVIL
jgi:co-chaperonin GroES (HSP10)